MRGVLGMRPALRPALTPIAQALRGLGLFGFSMRSLWSQGEQGAWYDPSDFERYMSGRGPEAAPTNYATAALASGGVLGAGITRAADYIDFNAVGTGQSAPLAAVTPIRNGGWYEMTFTVSNFVVGAVRIIVYGTASFLLTGNAAANGTYTVVLKNDTAGGSLNQCINVQTNATSTTLRVSGVSVRELTNVNTATLFQDAAGTTPVTAMEQPVGLMLDKRLGLVRGPELVTNGACTGTTGWTAPIGTLSNPSGATIRVDTIGGAEASLRNGFAVTAGKSYEVTFDLISANNAGAVSVGGHRVIIPGPAQNSGPKRLVLTATVTTNNGVEFSTNTPTAGFHIEVDNVSVREIPGNHASQATTTARPLLSARKNLLTYSEQLDNGAWAKVDTTITANQVIAPDGTLTGDLATEGSAGNSVMNETVAGVGPATLVASVYLKRGNHDWVRLLLRDQTSTNGGNVWVNLATGVIGTVANNGTGTNTSGSVENAGNGFYRVSVTTTLPSGTTSAIFSTVSSTTDAVATRVTGGTRYQWGAQLEYGPTATRYQRVNTATDYDWVGFPIYLKFDGVDDFLSMASVPFLPSDEFIGAYVARRMDAVAADKPVLAIRNSGQATSIHFNNAGEALDASVRDDAGLSIRTLANAGTTKVGELASCFTKKQGSTLSMSKNGAAPLTASTAGLGVANNVATARIGGSANGPAFYNGEIHTFVVRKGPFVGSDIVVLRAVANKSGVIL